MEIVMSVIYDPKVVAEKLHALGIETCGLKEAAGFTKRTPHVEIHGYEPLTKMFLVEEYGEDIGIFEDEAVKYFKRFKCVVTLKKQKLKSAA